MATKQKQLQQRPQSWLLNDAVGRLHMLQTTPPQTPLAYISHEVNKEKVSKFRYGLALYRVSQNDRINSAQLDSSLGIHKNCPKKHSCTIHSLREKYEKQSMTSLPVQEKNTLLNIPTAVYAQFKAAVQSVPRACRGRLEHAVEWLSSHVAASRGPPKYKQHADEQLSPFVLSLRLDTPVP
ncbi:hypothetical protein AVEN_266916-1 [Araneus ventricosus]|uniref:Uncharacterized protein n=1 Tax=Araneus ventricosus TaxID=182803 RepID=A0A4Y2DDE5_ARAVE|nr:hypothetical protein AVEN_123988-1 [Araneus ventricosus]GBM15025.1 hypothetical protein AVEN_266916-1 [Araneus ventricosus]